MEGQTLSSGYGHLHVRAFQERTQSELSAELAKLHEENPDGLKGLVIDLRDNPGGLLNQAVTMADHWIDDGLIVYTQGRDAAERENYRSHKGPDEPDYPIVVLVNGGSASASEIVAGALQDHGRGLVMGTRTFGKGSVQTVYPLEGGAGLRLTTALYYTPSGRSIQELGIVPDIEVHPNSPSEGVLMRRIREADLRGHFTHGDASSSPEATSENEGGKADEPASSADDADDAGGESASEDSESDSASGEFLPDDVALARALEVLKSWTYFDRLSERRSQKSPGSMAPDEAAPKDEP
ncbi:MAG: S41 family peptidase [Myxococcota bacterium]